MFDMGFLELMLVALVGLVVIGPERLPGAIRTCAIWINGIKRNISSARAEFERQIGADEIRRELHNEEVMATLRAARQKQEEMRKQIESGTYTGVHQQDDDDDPGLHHSHSIHPDETQEKLESHQASEPTTDSAAEGTTQVPESTDDNKDKSTS